MKQPKFIISGGGTGGHIYPAVAIANELKARFPEAQFLFVGAQDKMEMQKVPQAGYEIKGLWIAGLQRKVTFQNMLFPVKLVSSLVKSFFILKQFKPDVVIGTGGFASGAVLKVASMLGIPTVIQEQNSYPGITNKLLAKKANAICVAYENLERFFPKEKLILTGNPVRQDLLLQANESEANAYFKLDESKKTVLVLGGSLGARRINQLIEKELDFLLSQNIQIIWQCGKLYLNDYSKYNDNNNVQVVAFIDRMDLVYAAADIIVSRSGASSVSELCVVGKPTIFIPSPNVAEDHQTKNAMALVNYNAAVLIKDEEAREKLGDEILDLIKNGERRQKLENNITRLAIKDSAEVIAAEVYRLGTSKK